MKILLVAAQPMEFRGILRRMVDVRPVPLPLDWVRRGRMGGHEVLLAAHGAGWKRAAAATQTAIAQFAPDLVVSTGFCGALDESLQIADVVVASQILAPGRSSAPASAAAIPGRPVHGSICSIDHVARTAEEKRRLSGFGACAVEMEAAAVAECAKASGRPFSCVRAVTDLAGENLANDFNTALRGDGHFDTMLIFRGALRHPSARIPELARLGFRCARASRSLGDFFADCGF